MLHCITLFIYSGLTFMTWCVKLLNNGKQEEMDGIKYKFLVVSRKLRAWELNIVLHTVLTHSCCQWRAMYKSYVE